ncbi:hypothetical protein OAQ99_07480 [Candidatus Kapabacteria bacterium]|nr:hypothetical protein [Candidatus Kapabacteria bacterium]
MLNESANDATAVIKFNEAEIYAKSQSTEGLGPISVTSSLKITESGVTGSLSTSLGPVNLGANTDGAVSAGIGFMESITFPEIVTVYAKVNLITVKVDTE